MRVLPEIVSKALDSRKAPAIFTTVDAEGVPNSVYVGFVHKPNEETLVLADNYFDKTRKNIQAGCACSLLFISPEDKAYQLKGSVSYETSGEAFEAMKKGWLPAKYPGVAAVVFSIESVFCGAEQLL